MERKFAPEFFKATFGRKNQEGSIPRAKVMFQGGGQNGLTLLSYALSPIDSADIKCLIIHNTASRDLLGQFKHDVSIKGGPSSDLKGAVVLEIRINSLLNLPPGVKKIPLAKTIQMHLGPGFVYSERRGQYTKSENFKGLGPYDVVYNGNCVEKENPRINGISQQQQQPGAGNPGDLASGNAGVQGAGSNLLLAAASGNPPPAGAPPTQQQPQQPQPQTQQAGGPNPGGPVTVFPQPGGVPGSGAGEPDPLGEDLDLLGKPAEIIYRSYANMQGYSSTVSPQLTSGHPIPQVVAVARRLMAFIPTVLESLPRPIHFNTFLGLEYMLPLGRMNSLVPFGGSVPVGVKVQEVIPDLSEGSCFHDHKPQGKPRRDFWYLSADLLLSFVEPGGGEQRHYFVLSPPSVFEATALVDSTGICNGPVARDFVSWLPYTEVYATVRPHRNPDARIPVLAEGEQAPVQVTQVIVSAIYPNWHSFLDWGILVSHKDLQEADASASGKTKGKKVAVDPFHNLYEENCRKNQTLDQEYTNKPRNLVARGTSFIANNFPASMVPTNYQLSALVHPEIILFISQVLQAAAGIPEAEISLPTCLEEFFPLLNPILEQLDHASLVLPAPGTIPGKLLLTKIEEVYTACFSYEKQLQQLAIPEFRVLFLAYDPASLSVPKDLEIYLEKEMPTAPHVPAGKLHPSPYAADSYPDALQKILPTYHVLHASRKRTAEDQDQDPAAGGRSSKRN